MLWFTIVLVGIILAYFYKYYLTKQPNYPPGPRPWPLVGNYPNLYTNFVDLFEKWQKQYGDIVMFHRFGTKFVYISDYEIGQKAFAVDYPNALAGRPKNGVDRLSVGDMEVFFTRSMSPEFQELRKLIMSTLRKVAEPGRMTEISNLAYKKFKEHIRLEKEHIDNENGYYVESLNYWIGHNLLVQCFWGEAVDYDDDDYQDTINKITDVQTAIGNLQHFDLMPRFLTYLPYPPARNALKLSHLLSGFIMNKMKARRQSGKYLSEPKWFIDYAMQIQDEQSNGISKRYPNLPEFSDFFVANLSIDNYLAGMDAFGIGFTWAVGVLATYKNVVDHIRKEVRELAHQNPNERFNEKWMDDLHYTNAVINEIYRFNSLSTLTSFHRALSDVKIEGYDVPKDTIVALNIYAMHFNEKDWPKPFEFSPERFLNEQGKFQKPKSGFMPFGTGKRTCVAERYTVKESHFVYIVRTCMEYNVEWTKKNDTDSLIQKLDKVLFRRCEPFYVRFIERQETDIVWDI